MARCRLPDTETLTDSLNAMVREKDGAWSPLTIRARERNPATSTYPTEVLTCRAADRREVRLLCKYSAGHEHNAFGHRGGVAYEAQVYRQVLRSLPVSTPKFYGSDGSKLTGVTWLVVEYLDNSRCIWDVRASSLMREAARWLGEFHRANAPHLSSGAFEFINRHDADFYRGWANRTSEFAGHLHQRFVWLRTLCRSFEGIVDTLLASPRIVIHGEYYPINVLYRDGTTYPVDWESAAVGTAEIDLASLTDHWPAETVRECRAEYEAARWPEGAPADFEREFAAAQAYWHVRWLGDRPEWTHQPKQARRFEQLQSLGEQLGLI